jgi:hypothetical protein
MKDFLKFFVMVLISLVLIKVVVTHVSAAAALRPYV